MLMSSRLSCCYNNSSHRHLEGSFQSSKGFWICQCKKWIAFCYHLHCKQNQEWFGICSSSSHASAGLLGLDYMVQIGRDQSHQNWTDLLVRTFWWLLYASTLSCYCFQINWIRLSVPLILLDFICSTERCNLSLSCQPFTLRNLELDFKFLLLGL